MGRRSCFARRLFRGRLCDLVLKEQKLNDEFRNEVQTMESVKGDMRFSQIVDSFTCRGKGLI